MAQNSGTLVAAPVRPASDLDTFPTALASEIRGGHRSVLTISARNAISVDRREEGMTVTVTADPIHAIPDTSPVQYRHVTYRLGASLLNSDWIDQTAEIEGVAGAVAGGAGAAAAQPFAAEAEAAKAEAEAARDAAQFAVTMAEADNPTIIVVTKPDLLALTSIPGTDPAQPLRPYLLATVLSEGKNYRRSADNLVWNYESDALPLIQTLVQQVVNTLMRTDLKPIGGGPLYRVRTLAAPGLPSRQLFSVGADGNFYGRLAIVPDANLQVTYTKVPNGIRTNIGLLPATADTVSLLGSAYQRRPKPIMGDLERVVLVAPGGTRRVASRRLKDGTLQGRIQSVGVSAEIEAAVAPLRSELVAARGSRAALADRLNVGLTGYGTAERWAWGEWNLRETRMRLCKAAMGDTDAKARLSMALIGDSWTQLAARYSGPLAQRMYDRFGNAGPGWVGFCWAQQTQGVQLNGNIITSQVPVQIFGTWSRQNASQPSPDGGAVSTSDTSAYYRLTLPAGLSAIRLAYNAGGVIRYRWGTGAWTSLDASAIAPGTLAWATLAGLPAGDGTLDIGCESGTITLCGINARKDTVEGGGAAKGFIGHKLGGSGTRASQWTAIPEAAFASALQELEADLVSILHGTNDQDNYAPSAYATYIQTLINRIRAARPAADILLIAPAENLRPDNVWPMAGYEAELRRLAVANGCAFLPLQALFGLDPAEYGASGPRPLMHPDNIHPLPETGGRLITDGVFRLLTSI